MRFEHARQRKLLHCIGYLCLRIPLDVGLACVGTIIAIVAYFVMLLNSPLLWLYQGAERNKMGLLQRSIVIEAMALFTAVATYGIQQQHYQAPLKASEGKPLVVMIHGLLHNAGAWTYQAQALKSHGYDVVCVNWGGLTRSIETAVERVKKELERIVPNETREMVLVGHSTGSRIALELIKKHNTSQRFKTYVSLAGPTEGTYVATMAMPLSKTIGGTVVDDLSPKHTPDPNVPHARLLKMRHDFVIIPSNKLADLHSANASATRVTYDGGGHLSLLYSPQATQQILEALKLDPEHTV